MENNYKGMKIGLAVLGTCLALAGGIAWFFLCYYVTPVFTETTIELGTGKVSEQVEDYLKGANKRVASAQLDTSRVDVNRVGDYTVICKSGEKEFSYTIHVTDTVAPEIVLKSDRPCMATKRAYEMDDFVEDVRDASNEVDTYFLVEGEAVEEISFGEEGMYTFTVCAKDPSGNTSDYEVTYEFAEAPAFLLLADRYIKKGTAFNLDTYLFAYDKRDGVVTDQVVIEANDYDTNTDGNYEVTYRVTNSKGITTTQSIQVIVGNETNYNVDCSKEELELLINYGFFRYEPLAEENYEAAKELVKPTAVNISTKNYGTSNVAPGDSSGSGSIARITSDYVYILTNQHVANMSSFKDGVKITAYDRNSVICKEFATERLPGHDIAYIRVPVAEIPMEELLLLKEVYFDSDMQVTTGQRYFVYTNFWRMSKDVIWEDKIVQTNVTSVTFTLAGKSYVHNLKELCNLTARSPQGGQSGSGNFDFKGRLICVTQGDTYGRYGSERQSYGISVPYGVVSDMMEIIERDIKGNE